MPKKRAKSAKAGRSDKLEQLRQQNEEALTADGFDECLVGVCYQFGRPPVACYDYDACIRLLMTRDKMERDEAVEFFEFNTLGAWVGENTPTFINLFT